MEGDGTQGTRDKRVKRQKGIKQKDLSVATVLLLLRSDAVPLDEGARISEKNRATGKRVGPKVAAGPYIHT